MAQRNGSNGATLHDAFTARAVQRPDHVALRCGKTEITYAELAHRSDVRAEDLRRWGVRPGHIIPLLMGRSTELVTAILAILKTGAGSGHGV